jgi:hypothetical protein
MNEASSLSVGVDGELPSFSAVATVPIMTRSLQDRYPFRPSGAPAATALEAHRCGKSHSAENVADWFPKTVAGQAGLLHNGGGVQQTGRWEHSVNPAREGHSFVDAESACCTASLESASRNAPVHRKRQTECARVCRFIDCTPPAAIPCSAVCTQAVTTGAMIDARRDIVPVVSSTAMAPHQLP